MKPFFLFLILLISSFSATAQQKQAAWWMFGDSLSINFNSQFLKADTGRAINQSGIIPSADATISDAFGNLLFYTNGLEVKNRKHQVMPNGDLYPASSSIFRSLSNLIVPVPGSASEYFIFNNYGNLPNLNLSYSRVDIQLNNGLGEIVSGSKNIIIQRKTASYLAILQHSNNLDYWLIASNYFGDSLFSYPISSIGIGAPVIVALPTKLNTGLGKLKSSPNSEWIAATNATKVDLFNFDRASGSIIPYTSVNVSNKTVSAVAFSSNSSVLYAGDVANSTNIAKTYQFNLLAGSIQSIQNSKVLIDSSDVSILDVQLGITGKLYVLTSAKTFQLPSGQYYFSSWLGIIHCPNQTGTACLFQKQGVYLHGRRGGNQLPSLNQTLFRNTDKLQALAMRDTICFGDTVQLSAFGATADRFRWFPAGVVDTVASPYVKPLQTTTYTVIGFSACRQDTAQVTVTVLTDENTKPNLLAVSVDTVDETRINMSYSVNAANSLSLEQKTSNGWQVITALSPQSTASSEVGLNTQEQSYHYRLRSLNHCNSEVWSETHTTVLLQANDQQKEKVTLQWSAYKGWGTEPVTYQVWQKTETKPTYQLIPTLTTTDTTTIATIGGIGFKPCFRVKAIGNGQQSWSNSVCLEVANLPEFYNIITPNGDGLNDSFSIKNLNLYPQSKLQIYNRWGQQIFSSDNYQNNWQAEGQKSGIYFYRFITAGGQSYKGWVEVVR